MPLAHSVYLAISVRDVSTRLFDSALAQSALNRSDVTAYSVMLYQDQKSSFKFLLQYSTIYTTCNGEHTNTYIKQQYNFFCFVHAHA